MANNCQFCSGQRVCKLEHGNSIIIFLLLLNEGNGNEVDFFLIPVYFKFQRPISL